MRTRTPVHLSCRIALMLAITTAATAAMPVGKTFTYQGELRLDGAPIDGDADLRFSLWDDAGGGVQIGVTQQFDAMAIADGRFTVPLDFGAEFSGEARFLEIEVRSPAGAGAFTTLTPRQELTPAPYAIGLSLPFQGVTNDNLGGAFEIVNNDLGWAGVFRNNNPANPDSALNVTSFGGPAGAFLNDGGGVAVYARSPDGTAVHADTQGSAANATAIYGAVQDPAAGAMSAALRGENMALVPSTIGVWGSSAGSGWGVHGTSLSGRGVSGVATSDFGFGVHGTGSGRSGIGVYGIHQGTNGEAPGVDGVTNSIERHAAGVRGRAVTAHSNATTYGVLGTSGSEAGVGVRGESNTGVEGEGQAIGVYGNATNIGGEGVRGEGSYGVWGLGDDGGAGVVGEAGNGSTFGVWAIGDGGALSEPALRADGGNGPAIFAVGRRAIEGEGAEFGVRGVTWEATGVGGTFTNYAGGVALRTTGDAEIGGVMTVNVLEIMGGADLAERFEFTEAAEPGMVVAIDPTQAGKLCVSREAYNQRVAGVISGANDLNAGVVLGTKPADDRNLPVAMSGRVWVHCDTRAIGVEPGDLMTTSDIPGYTMPVLDTAAANGAIIGKAMSSLAQGESGMVLVLVNLQ